MNEFLTETFEHMERLGHKPGYYHSQTIETPDRKRTIGHVRCDLCDEVFAFDSVSSEPWFVYTTEDTPCTSS